MAPPERPSKVAKQHNSHEAATDTASLLVGDRPHQLTTTCRLELNSPPLDDNNYNNHNHNHNDNNNHSSDKMARLWDWLQGLEGSDLSSMELEPCSSGWGVFAKQAIAPGGRIGRISNAAVLSVRRSARSAVGRAVAATTFPTTTPTLEFVLWLNMCHGRRDPTHFHFPYLASLPSPAPNVPSWSASQREALKGTNLGAAAETTTLQRKAQYDQWMPHLKQQHPALFGGVGFEYEDLVWASGMYASRRFPAVLLEESAIDSEKYKGKDLKGDNDNDDQNTTGIMLPGFDLLNHQHHQPITWSGSCTHISFTAGSEAIAVGSEIYNNYGPKGNESLMMTYGFALANNVHDSYGLHLVLMVEAKADAGKSAQDKQHDITMEKKDLGTFQIHRRDSPLHEQFPSGLWRALNQMFVEPQDDDNKDNDEDDEEPVEIGLEAVDLLLETLQRRIQIFVVTEAQDSRCETDVERYRNGQRIVLEQAIETLEDMIPPEDEEGEDE